MGSFPKRVQTGPRIGWGSLDSNHHGPRVDGEATTLRSTWLICYLDNGMMPPPRFLWGIRLWIYAPSGRCWNIDLCWRSAKRYAASDVEREVRGRAYVAQMQAAGEWPPKSTTGVDYLTAMYGAHGLGLVERQPVDGTPA